MPAAIYTHPDFNAADADVTFQSSDGIQFHVDRKYLEANTGAFPGSEFDTRGEVTHLTEDSETLAILFQFVYPRRHPTLQDMGFATLMPVAEAVEKYQVFSAMNTCEMRLRRFVPEHPIEILVHGVKHDYRELREDTLPFIARMPFVKTAPLLPVSFLHPWVRSLPRIDA
ncbi:hypothetical protein NLJ89_g2539 [Agrocybe chaxingu]|uniref:BTB domain-containing protein n=1 Tax=Agrocybe chaxingu TaxID=84603 RepID=A0A9W8MWE0_9AGAR|nr:hypothetical protein NLJ89_g2539 [Agrocybe chaxingu]